MAKKKEPKKDKELSSSIQELEHLRMESLYNDVVSIIESARATVYKTANFETVKGYWGIGKRIVEEEQHGKVKAEYGKHVIKNLSKRLSDKYGSNFFERNLERMRKFYVCFPIPTALRSELSWTHYRELLKVESPKAREFYMNESIHGRWGTRTLERGILTKLYERTLMVQSNPEDVRDLVQDTKNNANEGDFTPEQFIKDPYNLAFTGIKAHSKYYEKDLEQALMDKLQDFIMELGRGFAFVGRQYRITVEDDSFYPDLVFYNYILKCFLVIDLKTEKLTHKDIGQMDFYVRYFEKEIRQSNDNPTIGLILCADKNHKLVKYTLLDDSKNIFASKYQLYLPSDEQLEKEIIEEKQRLEQEKRLSENE